MACESSRRGLVLGGAVGEVFMDIGALGGVLFVAA